MNISMTKTEPFPWMKERNMDSSNKALTQETRTLLRDLNRDSVQGQSGINVNHLWESSQQYANSLRDARIKNSKTLTELKKLRYNFKAISTQILRSKTSTAAKAAVGKASAEVVRLKRLRQSGQYDEEELQYAIAHAMAIERVAKKKVKHLQEEEMIKVKDDIEIRRQPAPEKLMDDFEDIDLEQETEDLPEEFDVGEILDLMDVSEFQSEMGDLMMSLLEDMDWVDAMTDTLSELMEGYETEMSPEDFKMFKIKHRNKEMRQIVEADTRYLKAVFENLQVESVPTLDAGTLDIIV